MQKKKQNKDSCAGKMTFLNFQGQLWVQPPMPNKKMLKNPNKNEKNAKDMQRAMPKNAKKKHNTRPKKK